MPSPSPADVKFEIGHVLFIDIVGYSRLFITEQGEHAASVVIMSGQDQLPLDGGKFAGDVGLMAEMAASA